MNPVIPPLTGSVRDHTTPKPSRVPFRFQVSLPPGADRSQVQVRAVPTPNSHLPSPDAGFAEVQPKKAKAYHEEWAGSVCVRIYQTKWRDKKRRKLYRSHMLVWFEPDGRHREKRATLEAARRRAQQIGARISQGQAAMIRFTEADRGRFLLITQLEKECGKAAELILGEYLEIKKILADVPALEAAKFFRRNQPAGVVSKTAPEIFVEMIPARKRDGAAPNTLDDLESRLGRFTKDFSGSLLAITSKEINDWLRKLTVGDTKTLISRRTRNNYRSAVRELYRFAREASYLPKSWNPLEEVPTVKNEPVRIEIFTPEEFVKITKARCEIEERERKRNRQVKTLIPFLAIGAFAGVRHEEMVSPGQPVLDWRDVDFEELQIHVPKEVARKIGTDRNVPISPNLAAWLKLYAKPNGPVCELGNANNAFQDAAREAGIKWKDNGLRKSFISYRMAIVHDIGRVADEAGTSPDRIRQNYKKVEKRMEREAHRWFNLWPSHAEVLQVKFGFKL